MLTLLLKTSELPFQRRTIYSMPRSDTQHKLKMDGMYQQTVVFLGSHLYSHISNPWHLTSLWWIQLQPTGWEGIPEHWTSHFVEKNPNWISKPQSLDSLRLPEVSWARYHLLHRLEFQSPPRGGGGEVFKLEDVVWILSKYWNFQIIHFLKNSEHGSWNDGSLGKDRMTLVGSQVSYVGRRNSSSL